MSGNAAITVPVVGNDGSGEVQTTSATGDGFITGVEPAKTPDGIRAEQQAARAAAAASQNPTAPAQAPVTNGERMFSATEVETFRSQERDKMHNRVSEMETQVQTMADEREAERARIEAEQKAIEDAAVKRAEDEMDVRDLLRQTREEFTAELLAAKTETAAATALLVKEQQYQELQAYRTQALGAVADRMNPEFGDFVSGESPEQIDASIADALERSDRIVQGFVATQQQQVQGMQGVRSTLPSQGGPLEEQQATRAMTPEQISALSPSEYAAMRGTLKQAGTQQFYGQR